MRCFENNNVKSFPPKFQKFLKTTFVCLEVFCIILKKRLKIRSKNIIPFDKLLSLLLNSKHV